MKAAVALLLAVLAGAAAAQTTLKPGLWELQHKAGANPEVDRALADMREQMEAMPPEQRRQMEARMASRGMQMAPAAGGGMAVKMCITREMAERNQILDHQGDCRTTRQQRSGDTLTLAFTCSNPPATGETQVTFASPESYSSRTTITSAGNGQPETMTVEGTGRWLGADCGEVKPFQPRK